MASKTPNNFKKKLEDLVIDLVWQVSDCELKDLKDKYPNSKLKETVEAISTLCEERVRNELEAVLETRGVDGCDGYCDTDFVEKRIKELDE